MAAYIRKLVSGNKARFKDEELDLDLDLVYVTDQLIIMGFPAGGLEGFYRNRRGDAKKFLDRRHPNNYWIFNLCPLTENSYDAAIFGGRVSRYPFPDHHVPPLAILALAVRELQMWLSVASERVAVLHCKAGKGRSGTLACAYLLSLDISPEPPRLQRSYTAKQWAELQAEEWMDVAETFEIPKDESSPNLNVNYSSATPNAYSDSPPVSNTSDVSPSVQPQGPDTLLSDTMVSNTPLTTSALETVLSLHTARRMKQTSPPSSKKPKQGVSIPSQRRFLLYWSLLLSHTAPAHLWPLIPHPMSARPKVKLIQITIRLREGGGTQMTIVKAVNNVLEKVRSTKGIRHGSDQGVGNLWISLARYDDELVEELEDWERWTRDGHGHFGKRHGGDWTCKGKGVTQLFEDGRWDKGKMIRSFARLRRVETKIGVNDHDEKARIYTHILKPLNQSHRAIIQESIRESLIPATSDTDVPPVMEIDNDDAYFIHTTQVTRDDGIILEAGREVRAKLYFGQIFMGWLWFIPAFHMSQPPPHTSDDVPQSTHVHLSRKDVDFPLGIGAWIVDIDIEMAWVVAGSNPFSESPQ